MQNQNFHILKLSTTNMSRSENFILSLISKMVLYFSNVIICLNYEEYGIKTKGVNSQVKML